ncbi:Cullin-like protein 5 [Cardamine amara subsp. amara]|uniref:Cullin-like protein 5 n=1 Tax=Cardamine amara subsp. amara TaxID=228776 RepID=A0ABD1BX27_CARAN
MSSDAVSDGSTISVPDDEVPSVFLIAEAEMVKRQFMRSTISDKRDVSKHQDDEVTILSRVKTSVGPRIYCPFPLRKPARDTKVDLDYAWRIVKPAIGIVLNGEPQHFSCAAIFNAVDRAWEVNLGEALFKLILEECEIHISAALLSLEGHCNDDPSVFSPLMEKSWLDFQTRMWSLSEFAGGSGWRVGGKRLWELGLDLFRKLLCLSPNVLEKVFSTILLVITDQRLGKPVDVSQLENLMDVFNEASLDNYPCFSFKDRFVQCAAEFYAQEARQALERLDFPQYLKYVEQRLGEEKEKCLSLYSFCKFEEPLIEVVESYLLGAHASSILEKGFAKLMDESCRDPHSWQVDLERLYNLFSETGLLNHLNHALRSYIVETGSKIRAQGFPLAKFKASIDKICHSYFWEDESLEKTVEDSFIGLGFIPGERRFEK